MKPDLPSPARAASFLSSTAGLKVTVMGLGINGGGLATALFFARRGAEVTVTDLRSERVLAEAMSQLSGFPIRYVLERHEERDFQDADVVIKNPAVSPASPYLAAARARGVPVETDLSVFLSLAPNPVLAVTGSKGKSTTASAAAFALSRVDPRSRLGGNITVSPLSFLEGLAPDAPVVLELSSWQLGDLRGRGILKPRVSAFTVILPDHLDKYAGMADYVSDKKVIFQEQEPAQFAVFNRDDPWQERFPSETRARSLLFSSRALDPKTSGAWLDGDEGRARLQPGEAPQVILARVKVPGAHNRRNLLCAGLMLLAHGVPAAAIRGGLAEFPGVEHRLERFATWRGITFYNDSAATIPHATVEALRALEGPVVLVTGGTDKNIDFSPLREVVAVPRAIVLLAGTGTEKMQPILAAGGAAWDGPYDSLRGAVEQAVTRASALGGSGGGVSILFSPGCTSFGMFLNEFDRG
ncbi:MAG TPA: UDP-N-acetylmuramoyl-L-alanine--D-glutamate ligase, partial [Spirochaetia bacterium]|nr:UDP-N-acetylmuramoyl-L-alanine--D-glutamate ligase [Spirochaetia bacterium]